MELWLDGHLVETAFEDQGGGLSPRVLTSWLVPTAAGPHEIVVRAYTPLGEVSQAHAILEVFQSAEGELESVQGMPAEPVTLARWV